MWREREIGSVEREGERQCGEREREIGSVVGIEHVMFHIKIIIIISLNI